MPHDLRRSVVHELVTMSAHVALIITIAVAALCAPPQRGTIFLNPPIEVEA
jgi:hypothetical protein